MPDTIILITCRLLAYAALFATLGLPAQRAEPQSIEFAKGSSSATLRQQLTGAEQMEYSLSARAGQKLTLQLTAKPIGSLSLRMRDTNHRDLPLTPSSSANGTQTVVIPATGDYELWVVRKQAPGSSTFRLKLSFR